MEQVLIIDDDVELCGLVAEYLEPEGYSVEAVHDGEQGVAPGRRLRPRLIASSTRPRT